MPTKSKWEIEAERLKREFDGFKKRVVEEVERCQEDYGLEICEDGLQDFFESLGIEYAAKVEGEIILRIQGVRVELDTTPVPFNRSYRPKGCFNVENILDEAVGKIIEEFFDWDHPNLAIDIEYNF